MLPFIVRDLAPTATVAVWTSVMAAGVGIGPVLSGLLLEAPVPGPGATP